MVQAVNESMKKVEGIYGKSIVNIASISAFRAQPVRWTYAATKGAIVIMTKCMALDLSKDDIRVNSVSPAWVWSPEVYQKQQVVIGNVGNQYGASFTCLVDYLKHQRLLRAFVSFCQTMHHILLLQICLLMEVI